MGAMKIAVILLAAAAAVKLRLDRSLVDPDSDDQWEALSNVWRAAGRQFPLDVDSLYHAAGLAKGEDLFDKNELKQFQAGLKASPDWAAASTWHLRVTVNSSLSVATNFGFPGFQVTVPAGAQGELQITDRVESSLDPSFRYLDGPDVLNGDASASVTFTKFCLRPKLCGEEDFCTDGWKPKVSDTVLPGNSRVECCEVILCSEAPEVDSCSGTIWTPKPNFTELQGAFGQLRVLWAKNGTGLRGSTPEECCEPAYCRHFACPSETQYTLMVYNADGRGAGPLGRRAGSSDDECCELKPCQDYTCSALATACHIGKRVKAIYCEHSMDCERVDGSSLAAREEGSTKEQCCHANLCVGVPRRFASGEDSYTCSSDVDGDGDGTQWYKKVDTNAHQYLGQTDEECCFPKYCSQYVTKLPLSKWKRNNTKGLQGSTDGECYLERKLGT
ncbi:unnamed protein product, partial [Effrenium voratum]